MHPFGGDFTEWDQYKSALVQSWMRQQQILRDTRWIRAMVDPVLYRPGIRQNGIIGTDQIQITGARTPSDATLPAKRLLNPVQFL